MRPTSSTMSTGAGSPSLPNGPNSASPSWTTAPASLCAGNGACAEYRLFVYDYPVLWDAEPVDMETVGVEPDPDGVMEIVRTRVNRPWASRVFISVQDRRK